MLGKNQHIIISVGLILLIALIILSLPASLVYFMSQEKNRQNRALQLEVFEKSLRLMEIYMEEKKLEVSDLPEGVLGFAIYHPWGKTIIKVGKAKADIKTLRDLMEFRRPRILDNGRIVFVRKLGGPPRRHKNHHQGPRPFRILYLELDGKVLLQEFRLRSFLFIFIGFLFVLMAAVTVLLYLKFRQSQKAQQANQHLVELGMAARTISHEIRNPLSAIRIQSGIIKKKLDNENDPSVKIISEEVARISRITDRVRQFLVNPLGNPEIINLKQFLEENKERGTVPLRLNIKTEKSLVYFDKDRLYSVFINLINNAFESMENREPVEVELEKKKGHLLLEIKDRGAGIAPDLQEKIFDPFFTTRTTGSGIGLALCKRYVEAADGRISFSRREGGGTVFQVFLAEAGNE